MERAPAIVFVHGGVSGARTHHHALDDALRAGTSAPTALDAAQGAVVVLEDDPALNAGFGATLTRAGTIELDAGIADGATGRGAGVANVAVENPIVLARRVMEATPHVLLTGAGAAEFARAAGLPRLRDTTIDQRERYHRALQTGGFKFQHYGSPESVDTVGAVALDEQGRLAAATSTGGVFGKLPGRVGDAPVFGAGYYASAHVAVVGTGLGEHFLTTLASFRVAHAVERGDSPQIACERVLEEIRRRHPSGTAGLLALDVEGRVGAAYKGASWSVEGPDGVVEPTPCD